MTLPKIRYKDVPENPELPPDMNYVYFENGEKFPLQIKKQTIHQLMHGGFLNVLSWPIVILNRAVRFTKDLQRL